MIRAVLDTNVVVSAQLSADDPAGLILDLALSRYFRCFVSAAVLEEYAEVLKRGQFGLGEQETTRFMRRFQEAAIFVVPRKKLKIASDPDDDKMMECALEARADFLVTGDLRHFPTQFQDIRVIAPRQFLTILASSPS